MSGIPLLFIYFRLVFEHREGEAERRGTVRLATGIQAPYGLSESFHFTEYELNYLFNTFCRCIWPSGHLMSSILLLLL